MYCNLTYRICNALIVVNLVRISEVRVRERERRRQDDLDRQSLLNANHFDYFFSENRKTSYSLSSISVKAVSNMRETRSGRISQKAKEKPIIIPRKNDAVVVDETIPLSLTGPFSKLVCHIFTLESSLSESNRTNHKLINLNIIFPTALRFT